MEKEKLISKLSIKDYNNQLEKILVKKSFSEDTKNLLLSMLYKIENSYDDFSLVNGDTKTKKETLEEILKIIEDECDTIEIVKTNESKSILEQKKIITYLNTKKMLYQIYELKQEKFSVPEEYDIIKPPLEKTLKQGYNVASTEIIRDFDGWSWHIAVEEIENLTANFIYQTLKILLGNEFLEQWKENTSENYVEKMTKKLEKQYGLELSNKLTELIYEMSIINVIEKDQNEKQILIEKQNELEKKFNEIENKKEYLNKLGIKKKKIVSEIKKIDDIINNDRKLKEEFISRNEKLDMNNRIFSLSDFVEILEAERQELIIKLNNYCKKMEPLNFVNLKEKIEKNLKIIKELDLQNYSEKIYNTKVKELIETVYQALKIKIYNITEKQDIVKLIYQIRYYSMIYVNKQKQVKDICNIDEIQRLIITKACKQKIITIISKNIKENYNLIRNILQTDIIELEKMSFKFMKNEDKIILEIFDEENKYKTLEFDHIEELNIKLNKKVKIFI